MTGDAGSGARTAAATYWVGQMEAGMAFIRRALEHPIEDREEPLVDIEAAAQELGVSLSFSTRPHAAGRPRLFLARPDVVTRLLAVASEFDELGHTLVVEDAFRTYEMQRDLALSDDLIEKVLGAILLAEPDAPLNAILDRLSVVVQTRPKGAGHMAGAAIDVSVIGPVGEELDRGGSYVTVSEAMPMDSPFVSAEAARNRRLISEVMLRHGFQSFPYEFWHYSCDDIFARVIAGDSSPARYGPVELQTDGTVSRIEHQLAPMHDAEALEDRLARAMRKASGGALRG